jgi:hypothetical protein|tara:strand:+ start:381 stop:554 length:174 start_codon:yes stop_codon:yes gene_type:complete
MNIVDLKMVVINTSALAISMSQIDTALKITLLVISIGYTLNKWYIEIKNKRNNKKNK